MYNIYFVFNVEDADAVREIFKDRIYKFAYRPWKSAVEMTCPRCGGKGYDGWGWRLLQGPRLCKTCKGQGTGRFAASISLDCYYIVNARLILDQLEGVKLLHKQLSLILMEEGGAVTNSGWAQVVAEADGMPMLAFPGRSRREWHFYLRQGGTALVCSAGWAKEASADVNLRVVGFTKDGEVDEKEVYKGPHAGAPDYARAFATAAIKRSRCYHCRCLHYGRQR